ncbi:MAG: hypothetical protein H0W06_00155, partial [Chloroflexia bacterium]|nr:hypothetical protein [Chloroflexia bacterium]
MDSFDDEEGVTVWPAGHRAALCLVAIVLGPTTADSPADELFSAEPYGATGLGALLDLLDDLDLSATIAPDAAALHAYAPLLRRCHA